MLLAALVAEVVDPVVLLSRVLLAELLVACAARLTLDLLTLPRSDSTDLVAFTVETMGAGTDLSALTQGGSFRVENMDPVLASATRMPKAPIRIKIGNSHHFLLARRKS